MTGEQKEALKQKLGRGSLPAGSLAQVANVICIGSGKGGVGKSTLTANLAAALAAEGRKVGILDADVWGYSIPRMYGLGGLRPDVSAERKIIPLQACDVKVMSIGFFVEEDAAVVWRGPMLHKALTQFLQDVDWGVLDYLLIDLPPGTGDVSMTLAQLLPGAQFLIVTTPQATAQKVARRAAEMAHRVDLPIARRRGEHDRLRHPSGERFAIFGQGGGSELADEIDVPLLGQVPLTMPLREQADEGLPLVVENPDDAAAQAIRQIARGIVAALPPAPIELTMVQGGCQRRRNPWACRCRWPRRPIARDDMPDQTGEPSGLAARGDADVPRLTSTDQLGGSNRYVNHRATWRGPGRGARRCGGRARRRIRRTAREDGTDARAGDRPLPACQPAGPRADRRRRRGTRPGRAGARRAPRAATPDLGPPHIPPRARQDGVHRHP